MMQARFRVSITPDDVGSRVSVRYRIAAPAGAPRHNDVVGILQSWSEGRLEIQNRKGDVVAVAEEAMIAGKTVPPPPLRRT